MKLKPSLETAVYLVVVILSLFIVLMMTSVPQQFKDSKIVYQAF